MSAGPDILDGYFGIIDLSSAARRLGTRAIRRRDGVMVYTTLDLAELPA